MATDTRASLAKLLEMEGELLDKLAAVHTEMATLVNGGDGIGKKLKAVEAGFADAWNLRYQSDYQFNFKEDRPHVKRWLRSLTVDQIVARCFAYIKDENPFIVRNRHTFSLFVRGFNSYAALSVTDEIADGQAAAAKRRELRGR